MTLSVAVSSSRKTQTAVLAGFSEKIVLQQFIKSYSKRIQHKYSSLLTSETEKGISVDENFMGLVMDHFRMLSKIREYDPNIRMRATSPTKFHTEHNELSRMISAIKKGWVIQYFYPEETVRQIQQPISCEKKSELWKHSSNGNKELITTVSDGEIMIHPYVLTREEEYVEEGRFMHHWQRHQSMYFKPAFSKPSRILYMSKPNTPDASLARFSPSSASRAADASATC